MSAVIQGALAGLACLIAASVAAQEPVEPARGSVMVELDGAAAWLEVWAESTAAVRDGEAVGVTVWALGGAPGAFDGDVVAALTLVPGEEWTASGQITRLEGPSFHGAILDTDFGASFTPWARVIEGRLHLVMVAEGPMGRAQGDTGQNDFTATVPGRVVIVAQMPLGAGLAGLPPAD